MQIEIYRKVWYTISKNEREVDIMPDFNAEEILAGAINEWLAESDIDGKTVNQVNLDRLNKANIMALKIFENPQEVEFEKPRQDMTYAQTTFYCQEVDIERGKNKELFSEFVELVDGISFAAFDGRTIGVLFSVDNVWEE